MRNTCQVPYPRGAWPHRPGVGARTKRAALRRSALLRPQPNTSRRPVGTGSRRGKDAPRRGDPAAAGRRIGQTGGYGTWHGILSGEEYVPGSVPSRWVPYPRGAWPHRPGVGARSKRAALRRSALLRPQPNTIRRPVGTGSRRGKDAPRRGDPAAAGRRIDQGTGRHVPEPAVALGCPFARCAVIE